LTKHHVTYDGLLWILTRLMPAYRALPIVRPYANDFLSNWKEDRKTVRLMPPTPMVSTADKV